MDKSEMAERKEWLRYFMQEPLKMKVDGTKAKIIEFYQKTCGNCYLSCSGGADSICLYHIIEDLKKDFPNIDIPVVFDDTGLEEPSVRERALSIKDIKVVKPKISFYEVLSRQGFPCISKEVAECVKNARRYLDFRERERERCASHKYESFYKKLFGLGEYSTKGSKDIGTIKAKEFP